MIEACARKTDTRNGLNVKNGSKSLCLSFFNGFGRPKRGFRHPILRHCSVGRRGQARAAWVRAGSAGTRGQRLGRTVNWRPRGEQRLVEAGLWSATGRATRGARSWACCERDECLSGVRERIRAPEFNPLRPTFS